MKKSSVFFTLILLSFLSFGQTQIPNSNFENWTSAESSNDSLVNWNNSIYYDTEIPLVGIVRVQLAVRESTNIQQGDYAVKMETKEIVINGVSSGIIAPGMITLGDIDIENKEIGGGIPFTDRPLGLSVFTEYYPVNNDTAYIVAYLTKWNTTEQTTDTIGFTGYYFTDTISEYTQQLLPFVYLSEEEPDTLNMFFTSSGESLNEGSTFYIDSLSMLYEMVPFPTFALPATEVSDTSFVASWFPTPNAENYYLDVATDSLFTNPITGFDDLDVYTVTYEVQIPEDFQGHDNYYYRVKVNYTNTTSIYSNVIKVLPTYPTICLPATEIGSESFRAHWTKAVGASSYNLDVATDIEFTTFVSTYENFNVNDTTYVVTGLDVGTNYFYRIKTVYPQGTSPYSNIIGLLTVNLFEFQDFTTYTIKEKTLFLYEIPLNSDIYIYDVTGRLYFETHTNEEEITIPLPITGVYLLEIRNNKEIWRLKFTN